MTERSIPHPLSEATARKTAQQWAIAAGKPPVRFANFAADMHKQLPGMSAEELKIHLQYFDLACEDLKGQWREFSTQQLQLAASWTIETVKHLAIVNAAGLAGAGTLVASQGVAGALKFAFGFFTIGLLLALLDLWLCSEGYTRRGRAADERFIATRGAQSWAEWGKAGDPLDAGNSWFEIAELVGWTSALTWVAGAVALAVHLF